jgi:hypothetical protein
MTGRPMAQRQTRMVTLGWTTGGPPTMAAHKPMGHQPMQMRTIGHHHRRGKCALQPGSPRPTCCGSHAGGVTSSSSSSSGTASHASNCVGLCAFWVVYSCISTHACCLCRYSTRPSDPRLAAAAPAPVHAPAPAASHVAAAGAEPPKLLVLHSDGTYRPAQIVMPQGQVAAAAPMPAASAAPAATTLTASAGAAVGADPRQGAANNLGFNGQQLLATLQQALLAQAAHQQQMQGSSAATQAGQAAYGGAAGTTAAPGTQASTQQVTYSYAQPGQAQLYGQVPAASATTTATQAQPYATQATTGQAYAPAQTYGQQGTYAAQTQNYATTAYTTTAAAPAAGTAAAGTTSATTQQPAATYAQAYQQWYPQQYLQSQQQQQQPSTR